MALTRRAAPIADQVDAFGEDLQAPSVYLNLPTRLPPACVDGKQNRVGGLPWVAQSLGHQMRPHG